MVSFAEASSASTLAADEKLAVFDSLPAVDLSDILRTGLWKGESFPSGPGSENALAESGWYGKRFGGENDVDPLIFNVQEGGNGQRFTAHPRKALDLAAQGIMPPAGQAETETQEPSGRLREVRHRGVVTGSMIYNDVPIIDYFRKVDDVTLLGYMDDINDLMKMGPGPFFLVLRRQS